MMWKASGSQLFKQKNYCSTIQEIMKAKEKLKNKVSISLSHEILKRVFVLLVFLATIRSVLARYLSQ